MNGLTPIGCLNRMALQIFVLKGKGNAMLSKYGYGACTNTEYGIFFKNVMECSLKMEYSYFSISIKDGGK
jgi:hypothetical protein